MNKVEMLIEAEKMFGEKVEAAYKAQLEKEKAVIQKHVEASGVKLAVINERFDVENLKVTIPEDGKSWGHDLDLTYRRDWCWREDGTTIHNRELKLNVSAMGSFGKDDARKVAYYALVGYFAGHMAEVEADLANIGWEDFDHAREALRKARDERENEEQRIKAEAFQKAYADFEKKLAAGVSIKVGDYKTSIKRDENGAFIKDNDGNFVYNVVPEIQKVEKVTAKMVYWAEWKGQDKKYDVISKLATGKWTIVG